MFLKFTGDEFFYLITTALETANYHQNKVILELKYRKSSTVKTRQLFSQTIACGVVNTGTCPSKKRNIPQFTFENKNLHYHLP